MNLQKRLKIRFFKRKNPVLFYSENGINIKSYLDYEGLQEAGRSRESRTPIIANMKSIALTTKA